MTLLYYLVMFSGIAPAIFYHWRTNLEILLRKISLIIDDCYCTFLNLESTSEASASGNLSLPLLLGVQDGMLVWGRGSQASNTWPSFSLSLSLQRFQCSNRGETRMEFREKLGPWWVRCRKERRGWMTCFNFWTLRPNKIFANLKSSFSLHKVNPKIRPRTIFSSL